MLYFFYSGRINAYVIPFVPSRSWRFRAFAMLGIAASLVYTLRYGRALAACWRPDRR